MSLHAPERSRAPATTERIARLGPVDRTLPVCLTISFARSLWGSAPGEDGPQTQSRKRGRTEDGGFLACVPRDHVQSVTPRPSVPRSGLRAPHMPNMASRGSAPLCPKPHRSAEPTSRPVQEDPVLADRLLADPLAVTGDIADKFVSLFSTLPACQGHGELRQVSEQPF